jgi:antitoxin (DNA-binding transcriptional repressor) of toxin-antitoxin stability system
MTYIFNMHEAKTKLSKLVELVEAGQEVQLARNGNPVVNLVLAKKTPRPLFGEFEPILADIPHDFDSDALMPEWEEAFLTKDQYLKPAKGDSRN